ncbi:MAG: CapA family protein [Deltaproteobacteria bacterium]|nr:CapA family protein [Deltaproteobacteria bacterium]
MGRAAPLLLLVLALGCANRHGREDPRAPRAEAAPLLERDAGAGTGDRSDGGALPTVDAGLPSANDADPADPAVADAGAAAVVPERRRVVIQGAGDYILHTRVHNSARFHAGATDDPDIAATEGYSYLIYKVKPALARGDLNLFNLETPLATERHPQSGDPPMLNGPPIAGVSLARTGFHVASLANNHAYDQDLEGVVETRRAAEDAGLLVVGGGADGDQARAPVFVERNGVRIGVLAFTETVNRTTLVERGSAVVPQVAIWRGDADLETVRSVRRQCDLLIVLFHWGGEFDLVPNRAQRRLASALCGEGVDLVLGSHSHTLQEVRRLDGPDEGTCVVAYSLGNFLSNQGLKYRVGWENPDPDRAQGIPYTRDSAILRATWEEDPEGRLRLAALEAVPLWTENNWLDRFDVPDFQNDVYVAPLAVSIADEERAARYAALYEERLGEIGRALGGDVVLVEP